MAFTIFTMRKLMPVIHLSTALTPRHTSSFLRSLEKLKRRSIQNIGIVAGLQDHMPVQVDKIIQSVKKLKELNPGIKIYGFTKSRCSAQTYYLLSFCDEIYTYPTTIFEFQSHKKVTSLSSFMNFTKLKYFRFSSQPNLLGRFIDAFSSPVTLINGPKELPMSPNLLQYSLENRQRVNPNPKMPKELTGKMLGQQMLQQGLVDGFGGYEQILREKSPDAKIDHLQINQNQRIMRIIAFVTSPFLLLLFFFKVLLKWSLIFYIWLTTKKKKQKQKQKQKQAQAQKKDS